MNQYIDVTEGFIVGDEWINRLGDVVNVVSVHEGGGAFVEINYEGRDRFGYAVDKDGKVQECRLSAGDLIKHNYVAGFGNMNRLRRKG